MAMTSKRRAELRGDAHHLTALVHVGKDGITDSLLAALDDALRNAPELVERAALRLGYLLNLKRMNRSDLP